MGLESTAPKPSKPAPELWYLGARGDILTPGVALTIAVMAARTH